MKTRKQVLAEFQRMHRQLCGKVPGFIDLTEYHSDNNCMWSIKLVITEFQDGKITAKSSVEWENYCETHGESIEDENLAALAEFKKKFNLK